MLIVRICGRHQMIHGEAEGPLGIVIAGDLHLGGVPPTSPSLDMVPGEGRHPSLLDHRDMSSRRVRRVCNVARGIHSDHSIQADRLA